MTWPPMVLKLAAAITKAEGSPPEWNNPGDLTGSDAGGFQTLGPANAEGVWKFADLSDGTTALYVKVARMLAGQSRIYTPDMTLAQVGMKYSGGDPNWGKNVAAELGVPETTTLGQLTEEQTST